MEEGYQEHNEEDEKEFIARAKSRKRGRAALIIVNAVLASYLLFFVGKSIYDACKDVDDDIVTLCGLSASKSKAKYAAIIGGDTLTIGDYQVYGDRLNLSMYNMNAINYSPLTDVTLSYVSGSKAADSEVIMNIDELTSSLNNGIDLTALNEGDYLLKKGSSTIKVASGPEKHVNVIYSLPDANGRRKQIKVYSYPKNPALVISVKTVNKLPSNYYDFVLIGSSNMRTQEAINLFSKYSVMQLSDEATLADAANYNSCFVLKYEEVTTEAESEIISSNFVSAPTSFKSQVEGSSSVLSGYDSNAFIRELGGPKLGGESRTLESNHSFDLASTIGEYDSGRNVLLVRATTSNVTSYTNTALSYFTN